MVEQRYSDGDLIFRTGDPADGVYRVREGGVRMELPRVGVVGAVRYAPGDLFGEAGFLIGDERPFTAVAEGNVTVDFMRRNEVLLLLSETPSTMLPLLSDLFGPLDLRPSEPAPAPNPAAASSSPSSPAEPIAPPRAPGPAARRAIETGSGPVRVSLLPDGKRVRTILGADRIPVERVPFAIGRNAGIEGLSSYDDIALSLDDRRPFNLSRRHFSIDSEGGALVVRDHGSYHGTTVNGFTLGREDGPKTALLQTGENSLLAGKSDSPYRFRILVDPVAS